MYRPPDTDSEDDDYDGFSFGDERPVRATAYEVFHDKNDIDNKLHRLVVDGDLEELKETLFTINFDVNSPLQQGLTLLHHAAKYGQLHMVKHLLSIGANPNRQIDSTTPLMEACSCNKNVEGAKEIVEMLLKAGAVVNISDKYGMTPLMFACVNGHVDVVQILLPTSSLESSDNQGWTAIFHAIENNQQEIVQLLINAGADVNIANRKGYTPRQVAQFHGFEDILTIMPREEYQYFVPLTFLTYNTIRDMIPQLFPQSEAPEYFPEIHTTLQQMKMENYLKYFAQNEITFRQFLTMTDDYLRQIGIKFPYQRKKILLGILNYHLNNRSKKAITRVKRKGNDTFYDILVLVGNQIKNIVAINASLEYVQTNLEELRCGTVDPDRIQELKKNIAKYKKTLAEVQKTSKYLGSLSPDRPPLYIDYNAFLKKNKEHPVKKYIKYSVLLGATFTYLYMKLRR